MGRLHVFSSLVLCTFYQFGFAVESFVNITIANGPIQGRILQTRNNNITYNSFQGIPYAEPPLNDLRFAPSKEKSNWTQLWNATYERSVCLQPLNFNSTDIKGSEDCLHLNVYSPNISGSCPILLWIHGGGFSQGSGSYDDYPFDDFIERGLVVVSINYRLGPLGFISFEDLNCPGNWGIKDQVMALHWISENGAFFGGNPNSVTVFGQSAGAASASLLTQTNQTAGKIHGGIYDSGSSLMLWGYSTRAKEIAYAVATKFLILSTDTAEIVRKLRKIDGADFTKKAWEVGLAIFLLNPLRGLPYVPTIEPDHPDAVYTNASDEALRVGDFQQVPILLGINSNEAAAIKDITLLLRLALVGLDLVSLKILAPFDINPDQLTRSRASEEVRWEYFQFELIALDTNQTVTFVSDDQFNRPQIKYALNVAQYAPTYFYEFGYKGVLGGNMDSKFPGAGHAEELPYLFQASSAANDDDRRISDWLLKMWTNFIKYGNPTPVADSALDSVIWQQVDPQSNNMSYMSINSQLTMNINPKDRQWNFYKNLYGKYGSPPYTTY